MTQWLRALILDVGDPGPLGLDGFRLQTSANPNMLRVTFDIERDETPWPNTAAIEVYNLNADHRNELGSKRAVPCQLQAGYADASYGIFSGMLRSAGSTKQGTDWVTVLEAGDGELNKKGEPIASGSIHKTWSRGTPIVAIVQDFAHEMDVDLGNAAVVGASGSLTTGVALSHAFTVDGPILDEWVYFMRSIGVGWSIQDSALQLRLPDVPIPTAEIISPLTGLIGEIEIATLIIERENTITKRKEQTEKTVYSGACLLRPALVPGSLFVLQARNQAVPCVLHRVRHHGDTHGTDWYSEFEGYAI